MKIELGKQYLSDGEVVTIISVNHDMKTMVFNEENNPGKIELELPIIGITENKDKYYFTEDGTHRWFQKFNLVEIPKEGYIEKIGRFIHDFIEKVSSRN
jgi:hypothetical protein